MSNMKPEVLRKMVTESRSLSPPLISRDKSSVSEMDILYNRIDQQVFQPLMTECLNIKICDTVQHEMINNL